MSDARGPLAAAADRHAAPRPDQPVLPRRRQGAGQHLPPDRGTAGHRGPLRHHRRATWSWTATGARRWSPGTARIGARAVVCASGGFEANIAWLRAVLGGRGRQLPHPRLRDNDGRVLAALYAHGAARAGEERGFHAVAIDARSPRFDGGIATRLDSIPFGIVVNRRGRRFYDEGEELWPKRYAIWGRNIAEQPGQIAYSIWDAKVRRLFLPPMYGPAEAGSVGGTRGRSASTPAPSRAPSRASTPRSGRAARSTPRGLDDCATEGIRPPKSHWAQPHRHPALLRRGHAPGHHVHLPGRRGQRAGPRPAHRRHAVRNVFAAGEIMSGNILSTGYLAGFGLTIGTSGAASPERRPRVMPTDDLFAEARAAARRSATPAGTARAIARCSRRWSAAPCSRPATSPSSPISATTAAPASTPACTRRRTSSRSTRRRSCTGCGRPAIATTCRRGSRPLPAWLARRPGRRGRPRPIGVAGGAAGAGRGHRRHRRAVPRTAGPYQVIPYPALLVTVALPTAWSAAVMLRALTGYWHDTHGPLRDLANLRALAKALAARPAWRTCAAAAPNAPTPAMTRRRPGGGCTGPSSGVSRRASPRRCRPRSCRTSLASARPTRCCPPR